jgi:FOG: TPR repeat
MGPSSPSSAASGTILKGVSVHWLQTGFMKEVERYGGNENSTVQSIENLKEADNGVIRQKGANITCPIDCNFGACYKDCLVGEDNVGPASIVFLHSYTWNSTVSDVVDSLSDYCSSKGLDPKRTYIWMDIFCTNLHRIADNKHNGRWHASEEFQKAIIQTREMCQKHRTKLLVLMSPWYKPTIASSIWDIYQIYLLMNGEESSRTNVVFLMPREEKNNLIRASVFETTSVISVLTNLLVQTNVEKLAKKKLFDNEDILELIQCGPGVKEVNNWLKDVIGDVYVDIFCSQDATKIVSEKEIDEVCNQLGPLMMQNGNFNQALRLFQKSLSLREISKEPDGSYGNPLQIASVMQNIGIILQNMDELEESLTYLKKALILREKKIGLYNSDTSDSYNSIGDVYFALEAHEEALEMYNMGLSIEKKIHGVNHSRTATAFLNVGKVLNAIGHSDEALANLQQSLTIRQEILGEDSVDVATTYECIAAGLSRIGDHEEALLKYKKALAIHESLHSEGEKIANICNNIAMAYCDNEDYNKSLLYFERAIELYRKLLGENHPHTEIAKQSYGDVLSMMCES